MIHNSEFSSVHLHILLSSSCLVLYVSNTKYSMMFQSISVLLYLDISVHTKKSDSLLILSEERMLESDPSCLHNMTVQYLTEYILCFLSLWVSYLLSCVFIAENLETRQKVILTTLTSNVLCLFQSCLIIYYCELTAVDLLDFLKWMTDWTAYFATDTYL